MQMNAEAYVLMHMQSKYDFSANLNESDVDLYEFCTFIYLYGNLNMKTIILQSSIDLYIWLE